VKALREVFVKYFHGPDDSVRWIRNPFLVHVYTLPNNLSASEERQLLELASDGFLRTKDTDIILAERSFRVPCPIGQTVKYLLPFSISHTCGLGFSALIGMKATT
jgi:hypothetical protein